MRAIKAGIAYFGLVFGAGFLMGALRVPLRVPRLGVRVAELIEMPFMFLVIVMSARLVVRCFALSSAVPTRLCAGFVALALLVVAEFALAAIVQGESMGAYIAHRDPVSGSVYLAMLALFALMPLLVSREVSEFKDAD